MVSSNMMAASSTASSTTVCIILYTVRHNYRRPSFKRHNLVNIRFVYMKISGNIAEGMLSVQI